MRYFASLLPVSLLGFAYFFPRKPALLAVISKLVKIRRTKERDYRFDARSRHIITTLFRIFSERVVYCKTSTAGYSRIYGVRCPINPQIDKLIDNKRKGLPRE